MGGSSKGGATEVEIIRYQVLIPVTEVQVRAGCVKDGDSHFLWELIHLRSQLQRRSEKVYQLSNSTSEFRNAFLRTIRQIIRESVRNMTVPPNKPIAKDKQGAPQQGTQSSSSSRRGDSASGVARTLSGKRRSKTSQRHSAGNMEQEVIVETYDNIDQNFHTRSKTVTDGMDEMHHHHHHRYQMHHSDHGGHHHHHHHHQAAEGSRSQSPDTQRQQNLIPMSAASTLPNQAGSKLVYMPAGHTVAAGKAGSPIWKLRENSLDKSATLPNPGKTKETSSAGKEQYMVCDDYHGYGAKTDHHVVPSGLVKTPPDC